MLKICMIGVRGHNGYVFQGLEGNDVEIAGICAGTHEDDIAPLRDGCREAGHSPREFDDYRSMLDEEKPDVVTVAGPFHMHAEICCQAFARGCHVFCEKPVANTMEELENLQGTHAGTGVNFAAMMGIRYDPNFYTARHAVRDGAIGTVRLMTARKSYRMGERSGYFKRRETSTGIIPWVGSHAIDWLLWFSGEKFLSVSARHSAEYNRGNGDMEISAACRFEMTNEVLATATFDYLRPPTAPTHGDDGIRVAGTDGVIEVRGGDVYLINPGTDGEETLPVSCDRQIFDDFLGQVAGTKECLVSAEETFDVTRACLLARRSADEGRIIQIG